MSFGEKSLVALGFICGFALLVAVCLHKYAWWKYSKGGRIFDPVFSSPLWAWRFMRDPERFIRPEGMKYVYWSRMLLTGATLAFLVGLVVFHLTVGK